MRRVRAGGVFIIVAASAAIACNALTGIGDLDPSGLDGGGSSSGLTDANTTDGSRAEGGSTSSSSSSSGTDASSSSSSSSGSLTCASAGGACVAKAPDGWDGPFRVFDTKAAAGASCPTELTSNTFELGVGTPTGNITCGACKCQSPTGGACSPTLSIFTDPTCPDIGLAPTVTDATTCTVNTTGAQVGAKFKTLLTNAGHCDPTLQGNPVRDDIDWTTTYLYCGSNSLTAIGCGSQDERCLPGAAGAKICIIKEAKVACPAPWTAATTVYGDVDDQRNCTTTGCSCTDPAQVGCKGNYTGYAASNCTGIFPFTASHPLDTCFTLDKNESAKASNVGTQGGTCNPSGTATVTGGLVPVDEGTTCCLP